MNSQLKKYILIGVPIIIGAYLLYRHFKKGKNSLSNNPLNDLPKETPLIVGVGLGIGLGLGLTIQPETIAIDNFGKLSICSNPNAPLLVVFGGIDVNGKSSGVYMWDYMNKFKGEYHIFVAKNANVNGVNAYKAIEKKISEKGITPSTKILYLFSGGYLAGMNVLKSYNNDFSSVYLVDIWMGNITVSNFYKNYIDNNAAKTKYYYTSFGANSPTTRDYIASKASVKKINKNGHMDTNIDATNTI
jgi:hypothetical protein